MLAVCRHHQPRLVACDPLCRAFLPVPPQTAAPGHLTAPLLTAFLTRQPLTRTAAAGARPRTSTAKALHCRVPRRGSATGAPTRTTGPPPPRASLPGPRSQGERRARAPRRDRDSRQGRDAFAVHPHHDALPVSLAAQLPIAHFHGRPLPVMVVQVCQLKRDWASRSCGRGGCTRWPPWAATRQTRRRPLRLCSTSSRRLRVVCPKSANGGELLATVNGRPHPQPVRACASSSWIS